jgi:ketosteroid isomerase-like protein
MTNVEIVRSTYEGKNSEENGRNLTSHADGNIVWTEAKGFPYGGTYVGLEAIGKNVFHRLATEWTEYKFTPEGFVAEGDKVVAYGTYTAVNNSTGKPLTSRVAHLWQLKDGKIVSFEQFVDSQTVNDTFIIP